MDSRRKFPKPFSGPPYHDRGPGLFEDLNKAWQSIDLLKEQLLRTEKKLYIARKEPTTIGTIATSAQEKDNIAVHSKVSGQRKRKIFRLEDKLKPDSSLGGAPNGEHSALENRLHPGTETSQRREDSDHAGANRKVYFVPETVVPSRPQPSFLNVDEFTKFKKTLIEDDDGDDDVAHVENQYSDISLVPIKVLNDRLPTAYAIQEETPLHPKRKTTRLDVQVTRAPKPPSSPPVVPRQTYEDNFRVMATSLIKGSHDWPSSSTKETNVTRLLKTYPGGVSGPIHMTWEPVQPLKEPFTSKHSKSGFTDQPRNVPIKDVDREIKTKTYPVVRKVSSEAVVPKGYPGFTISGGVNRPKIQNETVIKHSLPSDSTAQTKVIEPPLDATGKPPKASNEELNRKLHSGRPVKQKKIACESKKIEDYAINPFSWRKGQALVLKELGPFKSSIPPKKKDVSPKHKSADDDDEPSTTLKSVSQLPKDVQEPNAVDDDESLSPKVPLSSSNIEAKSEEVKANNGVPISSPKKPPKKKLAVSGIQSSVQSTPKMRHYDQDSVRKYMKKQQADRRNKLKKEKLAQLSAKENKQQKLRDLELKQKELAGSKVVLLRRAQERLDIALHPGHSQPAWPYPESDLSSHQSSDAVVDDDDENDTDYIWAKVVETEVPRRGSKKPKPSDPFKTAPVACSTSASGNEESSRRDKIIPEQDLPSSITSLKKNFTDPHPEDQKKTMNEEMPTNEKLKSLATLYLEKVDTLMNQMKSPGTPHYEEKGKKIVSLREKALRLQKAIDAETEFLHQKLQLHQNNSRKDSSAAVPEDVTPVRDVSAAWNIDQLVAKLSKSSRSTSSLQSSISEGTLHSDEQVSAGESFHAPSKLSADTVIARKEPEISFQTLPAEGPKDWRSLIPQDTPDPYNFINVLVRRRASAEDDRQGIRMQESGSFVMVFSNEDQENVEKHDYTSDFEDSSMKLSSVSNNRTSKSKHNGMKTLTPQLSKELKKPKSVEGVSSSPSSSKSSSLVEVKEISSAYQAEDKASSPAHSSLSSASVANTEQHLVIQNLPQDGRVETVSTPISSTSLSQHTVPISGPPSDIDDQLSEGVLSSLSDISQMLGVSSPRPLPTDAAPKMQESSNDTPLEKNSLLSELKQSESIDVEKSSSSKFIKSQENEDNTFSKSNVASVPNGQDFASAKMSPNTLRLRLSTELTYLDNVQESLGQLQDMERIRAVSLAQQEAVALAQVIQSSHLDPASSRTLPNNHNYDLNPSVQLLQGQTEVAKLSAEAAKQLAEINKTILEQHGTLRGTESSVPVTDTVAAAAAAAVTAAISQLKQKLQQSRSNHRRARLDSSTASRSSDHLTTTGESERSPGSSESQGNNSSSSSSSGHSQSRKNASNGSESRTYKSHSSRDERLKSTVNTESLHGRYHGKSPPIVSSQNSIIEELSSGPLSPSISECFGGAGNNSKNEEQISSKLDTSVTEEEAEEKSFRMLLPSESHRRSSLSHRHQRTGSPASDLSKRSSISDALSVSSEDRISLNGGDVLDDSTLFSGENSLQQFTLRMVRQYMKEEAMRAHHQNAVLKLQEQALLEKTKAEIAWIKLQKRQCRIKGEDDKMPPLCKKQRTILLKLKHDKAEIKRIREAEKAASQERQLMLMQQEQEVRQQLSSSHHPTSHESDHQSMSSKCPSESSSAEIKTQLNADLKADSGTDVVASISDRPSSSEIKSDSSLVDSANDGQLNAHGDSASKSKSLVLSPSPSTTQVLQGLKKLQISKRYLTKREQKLLQRRKNVEELLRWQQKLDHEEIEVQEMERKALEILGDKRTSSSNLDSQENSSPPSSSADADNGKGEVPSGANTLSDQPDRSSSIVEHISMEKSSIHVTNDSEVHDDLQTSKDVTVRTASTSVDVKNDTTRARTVSVTISDKSAPSATANNSSGTFESSTTMLKDGPSNKSSDILASSATAVSEQTVVKARSVVLRSPLTPLRTQARKRRDSSGSEDSCTISQSETASDPSDIEGRIYALKRDLRQRKNEAERLRREQKRKNKERLKAQEASLLKQIEAYDRYILEAKLDLQKEIEQAGQAKPTVRPVIKQPKVAESKRLQRQMAVEKSPEAEEKKTLSFSESRDGNSDHTLPVSARHEEGWPQPLESNASSVSQPTSLESSEGSFDSFKGSRDGDVALESGDVRVGDHSNVSEDTQNESEPPQTDGDAKVSGSDYSSTSEETLKKTERGQTYDDAFVAEVQQESIEQAVVSTSSNHLISTNEKNQFVNVLDVKSDVLRESHIEASVFTEIDEEIASLMSTGGSSEGSQLAVAKNELLVVSYADSGQPLDLEQGNLLDDVHIAQIVDEPQENIVTGKVDRIEQEDLYSTFDRESADQPLRDDQVDVKTCSSVDVGLDSATYIEKKIQKPVRILVEGIIEDLLHSWLADVTEELKALRAQHVNEELQPQSDERNIAKDAIKLNQSHHIADSVLDGLLNESILIAFKIRCQSTRVHNCAKRSEGKEENVASQEATVAPLHSESFVSRRVNDILSEVIQDKKSPGTSTRPQDILVLSFPDAFSPPEIATPPPTGSPVKGGIGSPIRRPSSPVLGESTDLGPAELEARLLALQGDTDLLGDQEWFDDDFGLSTGSLENRPPIQHYQIYPYQDSYYIREIPNKPPPPYTPPGQALSTFPASTLSPLPPTLNGALVSSVDLGHSIAEIFQVISYDETEIRHLVDKAVGFCHDKLRGVTTDKQEPEDYFAENDLKDNVSSCCRRAFARLVLHLTEDTVKGIYEAQRKPKRPPWQKPEWPAKSRRVTIPNSPEELVPLVQDRVLELVVEQKKKCSRGSAHLLKWGRKKRDFVDEILLQELRKEEAEWVTYDEDEVAVKMQLTDSIFDELIGETMLLLKDVFRKKYGRDEETF